MGPKVLVAVLTPLSIGIKAGHVWTSLLTTIGRRVQTIGGQHRSAPGDRRKNENDYKKSVSQV